MNKDELTKRFPGYGIIHPSVVNAAGSFISYDVSQAPLLTEAHYASRNERSRRRKRSPNEVDTIEVSLANENFARASNRSSIDVRGDMHREPLSFDEADVANLTAEWDFPRRFHAPPTPRIRRRYLHFNVSAFGSNLQIRVENKATLIAPGAKSILFTSDGRKIEKVLSSSCLYFGTIPHRPRSKVAISNCNGLAGLIQTEREEFFIEPIEDQQRTDHPQPHVIYRRSARSKNEGKRVEKMEDFDHLLRNIKKMRNSEVQNVGRRTKRHAKRQDYNIEVLLTVDSEVVQFHGRNNVENYLLTLMNIVDEIYHDSSLGEHVNLVLSRLYQLDEARSRSLIKRQNPAVSLKNVCRWAHRIYQTDPPVHGRSPDHSIFLTRKDFGPAGYAHVAGMCQALRSCSINFEDGFSSAFVVAHETGHVLGMEHDGEGNQCGDETSMGSIMAPLVQAAFHRYHWSRCSQQELRRNLPSFACLRDDPHSPDWGPVPRFPGVTYSMDDQCRFDFGQGYKRCTAFRNMDVCRTLWCSHDDNPLFCKTKKGPPVDGTECGDNMWCFRSHCVWRDQRQQQVNGNWGGWSPFSECSRSCGTGVKYRSRLCDNPAPSNGGSECLGQNVDYDLCNKRPCPRNRDFRADQCTYRNTEVQFKNQRHKWLPYEPLSADLKCDLYCVSKKTSDVVTMGDFVADGTLCSYDDPHGICIRGECVDVGCDKVLGSTLREDNCGVCGGNGSKCRNITTKANKRINRKVNSYMRLLKIPQGARHVRIAELPGRGNGNLIALKSRSGKNYLLNGKSKLVPESATPHRLIGAGTLWAYESSNQLETIRAHGPTNSDVILMALVRTRNVKLSISVSYVLHVKKVPKSRDTFRYEVRRWTSCSVTCGTGTRRARYGCRSQNRRKWVSKRKCKGRSPRTGRRRSHVQPCSVECRAPARWVSGRWRPCSTTCGADGWQEREVSCHRANGGGETETVHSRLCLAEQKPMHRRSCRTSTCPPTWRIEPWSQCSRSCGEGVQRRRVQCRAAGRIANSTECSEDQPITLQTCQLQSCHDSLITDATTSSSTSSISSTRANTTLTGQCAKKEPIFCKAMSQYCKIESFRKLCCRSCRDRSSNPRDNADGQRLANARQMDEVVRRGNLSQSQMRLDTRGSSVEAPSPRVTENPLQRATPPNQPASRSSKNSRRLRNFGRRRNGGNSRMKRSYIRDSSRSSPDFERRNLLSENSSEKRRTWQRAPSTFHQPKPPVT